MNSLRVAALLALALASSACDALGGDPAAESDEAHAAPAGSGKDAHAASSAEPGHKAAAKDAKPAKDEKTAKAAEHEDSEGEGTPGAFGMPFAWEVSRDEPLAKTRSFLVEVLGDNASNVELGKEHFSPFAETQKPRATIVTCADSRVQASAWDATPENDDFTVRNIGNQVANAHGSVEYGVEHLHTPVLMIIGHTGCGAIKAALEKPPGLDAPILNELKNLKVEKRKEGQTEKQAFTAAVIANVNQQVAFSTQHFGKLIQLGQLTVIGAVYDFRNDMGKGFGRLNIVNVNGNDQADRLKAFSQALLGGANPEKALIPQRPLPELSGIVPAEREPARVATREMHAQNEPEHDHEH